MNLLTNDSFEMFWRKKPERDGGTFPESWLPEGELALFTLSLNNCCSINKLHCIGSSSCQRERRNQQLNSCLRSCRCSFLSRKMEIWAASGAVVVLGWVTVLKTKNMDKMNLILQHLQQANRIESTYGMSLWPLIIHRPKVWLEAFEIMLNLPVFLFSLSSFILPHYWLLISSVLV